MRPLILILWGLTILAAAGVPYHEAAAQAKPEQRQSVQLENARSILDTVPPLLAYIPQDDLKAMILTELAKTQGKAQTASAGFAATQQAIAAIRDPSRRDYAFQGLVEGQARAGDLTGARKTLGLIKGPPYRVAALVDIASVQAESAQRTAAAATLRDALTQTSLIQPLADRNVILQKIAAARAEIGEIEEALQVARSISYSTPALMLIARALAKNGDTKGARRAADAGGDSVARILGYAAVSQALVDDVKGASELVAAISDGIERSNALEALALAQVRAGNPREALSTAMQIQHRGLKDFALRHVAQGLADANDILGAITVTNSIVSTHQTAIALGAIAGAVAKRATAKQGYAASAQSALSKAIGYATVYPNYCFHALAFLAIAEAQAKAGQDSSARDLLQKAGAVAIQGHPAESKIDLLRRVAETHWRLGYRVDAAASFQTAVREGVDAQRSFVVNVDRALFRVAISQAHSEEFLEAVQTASVIKDTLSRIDALRGVASVQARSGDAAKALGWAGGRTSHLERAAALTGVAEGILEGIHRRVPDSPTTPDPDCN